MRVLVVDEKTKEHNLLREITQFLREGNKKTEMKILVVGGGAREHALVWKIAQSPRVKKIFVAPGNAGTASIAQNLPIEDTDIDGLAEAHKRYNFDLVIVGGERTSGRRHYRIFPGDRSSDSDAIKNGS